MSTSPVSSASDAYAYAVQAPAAPSQSAAFSVDGTPPPSGSVTSQPADPGQQAGAVHQHHHHGGAAAGAGLVSASGTAPQVNAASGLSSALNVLA